MSESIKEKMQTELTEKIGDAFETVINQKNEFYQKNPTKIPDKAAIDSLISSSALANSAISGSASLIPGPWGMMAVVPELVLVIRNQIGLIYDIAAAQGKRNIMTKELAASIFMYSLGTTTGSLLVVQGGRYIVKRASLQVFQRIIAMLGGRITQQALKSALSKWLPGVGAVAMAAWTNYTTRQIGNKAKEILNSNIDFDDNIQDIELIQPLAKEPSNPTIESKSLEFYKIQILIAMSKIDGDTDQKEAELIGKIIENSELSSNENIELISLLSKEKVKAEGLDAIKNSPDDAITLLSDLTALAKINEEFHITEKLFIKQIGKALGYSDNDIEEVLNA